MANLTKAPASTVFNQYPDQGVSDTRSDYLNELFGANNTIGRNEVLVRYSGGSVVWAISFREFADGGNNNPSRDAAQTVWQKCLPSATATSGVKFYGVGDNLAGDTDAAVRTITVPYASAQDTKILSFSEAYAATISTYTLTKWNAGANDFATPISGLSAEAAETKASNIGGAKYKLVVNFVSGGSETYYLELLGADTRTLSLDVDAGLTRGDYLDETGSVPALKIPQNLTIIDYIKSYKVTPVTPNASVLWHFETAGEKFDVESEINAAGEIIGAKNDGNAPVYGVLTNALTNVTATVKNEYGQTTQVLLFAGKATRTPVEFTLSPSVILTYNGVEYRSDAGTLTFFVGDTISLKAVGGDYGIFYRSSDKANPFVTTTADELEKSFTIPAGGIGSKIHFESTKPSDVTSSGITVGRENVLTSSVTLTSEQTVNADTTVDLNGQTISMDNTTDTATDLFAVTNGTLTLKNGTIKTTGKTRAISVEGASANVVLENMTIDGGVGSPIVVTSGATNSQITITGGSITGHGVAAIQVNGTKRDGGSLNIDGAKISSVESTWGPAIYLAGPISTTVSGASEISGPTAIEIRNGSLTVNGGTITSTNAAQVSATANGNGPSVGSGAALVVSPHQVANLTLTVNLFGGSFNGTQGVKLVDVNNQTDETGTVTIVPSITNISNEGAWRLDNSTGNAVYTKVPAGS